MRNLNKLFYLTIFSLLTIGVSAREQQSKKKETPQRIVEIVDQMPKYPGGIDALINYLSENIQYPNDDQCIHGKVILQFLVEKDGSIGEVNILKSLETAFDNEAIRVIKAMPKWIPVKQNGKNVAMPYTLPITFKLQ